MDDKFLPVGTGAAAYAAYLNGAPWPTRLGLSGAARYAHIVYGVPKTRARRMIKDRLTPVSTGTATFRTATGAMTPGATATVTYGLYAVSDIDALLRGGAL